MAIATQDDDSVGLGFLQQIKKALTFFREVSPSFPTVGRRNDLNTGCDYADFSRLAQGFIQPFPLGFAKDFGLVRFVRPIGTLSLFSFGSAFQSGAEIAGIQEDELNAFSFRADRHAIVNPWCFSTVRILGFAKEIEEDLLGLDFLRVFDPGIVFTVVVVIPCPKEAAIRPKFLETRYRRKGIPFALELIHVAGISIDVVTKKDENVGLGCDDTFPNRLWAGFLEARTECDCAQGFFRCGNRTGKQKSSEQTEGENKSSIHRD